MNVQVTRFVHRDYGKSPLPAVTAIVIAKTATHWRFHVHAEGVRQEGWSVEAWAAPAILDLLLPPADRVEDAL